MEIGKHGIMSYTFLLHRRRAWPREVGSLPRAVRTCGGGVGGVAGSHAGETPGGCPASGSLLQGTLD